MHDNETRRDAVRPAQPSCPICRGETDPVIRMLTTLCKQHYDELEPISPERIAEAFAERLRARRAAIEATPSVRIPSLFFRQASS